MVQYSKIVRRYFFGMAVIACIAVLTVAGVVGIRTFDLWQTLPPDREISAHYGLAESGGDQGSVPQTVGLPAHVLRSVLVAEDPDYLALGTQRWRCLGAALLASADTWFELCRSSIASSLSRIILTDLGRAGASAKWHLSRFLMTIKLERGFSRRQILDLYISQAYFGRGAFGVRQASTTYFGKPAGYLTIADAALLAALLKAPRWYDPEKHPGRARQRRNLVLSAMIERGMISPVEGEAAQAAPLLP